MAEPFTIYKVTILYMLDKAEYPMTNTLISNFFMLKDYTDFFHVQEALLDLEDAELIDARIAPSRKQYQYTLTPAGKETLGYFTDKITEGIAADVHQYLEENEIQLRKEHSVFAEYYKTTGPGYAARCQLRSGRQTLVDLTVSAGTREQAEAVCNNWRAQNEEIYFYLMDLLLK